jgi:hypothetical protein
MYSYIEVHIQNAGNSHLTTPFQCHSAEVQHLGGSWILKSGVSPGDKSIL